MAEFDYNSFSQSLDEYKKFVNNKHWADLTESETFYVEDKEKLKNRRRYIREYIMPLLFSMKNSSNFKFSHSDSALTCRNMRDDIHAYYKKLNYNEQDLFRINSERKINRY